MNNQSAQRGIKAALKGNWDEAIEFNLQALKTSPCDTDTLNRLAHAYAAIGQTKNAQKIWNKVLHLDPYNPIAAGQLAKLKHRQPISSPTKAPLSANIFVDEPGKTKTIFLCRLANTTILASLESGQPVALVPKKRSIEVTTASGEYLGSLPEDISVYIKKLIKAGNKYDALIRKVEKNTVQIFVKEVKRAKRYQNAPSFPTQSISMELESFAPIGEENDQD